MPQKKNRLKSSAKKRLGFSRLRVYLFVALFAVVGTFLLLRSFAGTSTVTFSGTLNNKHTSLIHVLSVTGTGMLSASLNYSSKLSGVSVQLLNSSGQILATGSAANPSTLSASVTPAAYTFRVSEAGKGSGSYTLSVAYPTPDTVNDTTAPAVSLTNPASNATVSGTVNVTASASDNVGVSRVEFRIDNNLVSTSTASPYSYGWNTASSPNGGHVLTATAFDAANNSSTSSVSVTVSNAAATSSLPSSLGFNTLAFADEFTGGAGIKPSSTNWGFKSFSGNSCCSIAYFDGNNQTSLDGSGNLDIRAVRMVSSSGTTFWDTAWMESKVGVTPPLLYEARAKVPATYGMWSAPAWSYPYPYGTACGGEVDNVEQLAKTPSSAAESIHWCDSSNTSHSLTRYASTPTNLTSDYHTYTAALYPDHIDYYVDGIKYNSFSKTDTSGYWPFGLKMSFNIDLDVGKCGTWADCPPATAPGTADMLVDYFRVYTP
jgi:hypothetical protein